MKASTKLIALGLGIAFSAFRLYGQQPELVVQTGHTGPVNSVAFISDGRYVLTGSDDKTAKLWDVATGMEVRTFQGHLEGVQSVAFSPDGRYVLTGSDDHTAKLWDIATGIEIRTFRVPVGRFRSLAFSPNGQYVFIGGAYGMLCDVTTGMKMRNFLAHDILSMAFSRDGQYVLTGNMDETTKLWDASTGKEIRTFQHSSPVLSVAFSPDGRYAVTGSNAARLWDVSTGVEIRTFSSSDYVESIAFSPDGRYVLTGGYQARLWDISTGIEIHTFPGHSVAYSPDGRYVLTGNFDGTAKLWDASSGMEIRTFRGYSDEVEFVSFSPEGRYVFTGSSHNTMICDVSTGKEIRTFQHSSPVLSMAYSPDGRYMLTGSLDGTVKLWDVSTGVEILTFQGHSYWVYSVAFSSDGRYVLTGGSDDRTTKVATLLEHGKVAESHDVTGNSDSTLTEAVLSQGSKLGPISLPNLDSVLAEGINLRPPSYHAKLWDVSTGKEIRTFQHSSSVLSVAFSLDGRYVRTGSSDGTVKLWDTTTGRLLRTMRVFQGDPHLMSLAFSPDCRYVLIGHLLYKICELWDVLTGMKISTFQGHSREVNSVAFSSDSLYALTGSSDKTAKLWDVSTGMEIRTFQGHSDEVSSVAISPNGRYVLTGSLDKMAKLWDSSTGQELASLIGIDRFDYVICTPDNYYTCSKGALRGITFRIGNKIFPFEQFDLKLNRPDIVMQRMGLADPALIETCRRAYLRRLHKMGFKEEDLSAEMHLPEVKLDWKNVPASTGQRQVNLSFTAWDDKYRLDRINVYINDVAIFGVRGINLRDQKTQKIQRSIPIELSAGTNKIQVSVHNEKGVESLKETVYVMYTGPALKPDLYIVAIGASQYQNRRYNLQYAAKDASDIVAAFELEKGKRFGDVKVLDLTDDKATRENIIAAKQFFKQSRGDDIALLFVAGHGLVDSEYNYYFGTYDVNFRNPALRGLPYEEIDNLLDGIPARKKLLLLDACFSGEIDKTEMQLVAANVSPEVSGAVKMRAFLYKRGIRVKKGLVDNALMLQQDLFADLRRGTGAVVISSSSGDEYSFEGADWRNGVFTYSLLEGLKLKKADQNNNGKIQVSELQKYVMERVKALTNGGQNPTVRQENLADDFVVY